MNRESPGLPTTHSIVVVNHAGRRRSHRRGTTTVEFALVAIPLFLFVFTSIEFGRGLMVVNTLEEAARSGCRAGILNGAVPNDIEAQAELILSLNGIDEYEIDYSPKPLNAVDQWEPITVTVSANFGDISWLPMPSYLANMNYTASATMPKESRKVN